MSTPIDAAADPLLAVLPVEPGKPTVSAKVARQALYLLGDNENWSERPSTDDMRVWSALRHHNEAVRAEVAALFPQQTEALKASVKSWGLDWLRSIVLKEREDALAVVAEFRSEVAADLPAQKAAAR